MMGSRISLLAITVVALVSFVACGGGSIGTKNFNTTFTIGGTVSGIPNGDSVILADNGSDVLTVGANGNFTFNKQIASGSTYNVTVQTPPPSETCSVTNASGTATANVTNVSVTCSATSSTFTIGGNLSGLTSGSVVLQDNGGDDLTLSANGAFAFATPIASGSTYAVTVSSQPSGQICNVTNDTGTATANVTNVTVACAPNIITYTIGGNVSGLTSGTVVLQDNGGDNLSLAANGGFTFHTALAAGTNYNVTVLTQPAGQTCSVTNGTGTANANVTNVSVTCSGSGFTIGGTLSGLASGATVVLADNGAFDTLTLAANGSFTFAKPVAGGTTYNVTVATQPNAQNCTVTSGSGTANANVTNISVACVSQFTIGGTVSGLASGANLILDDNGAFDSLTIVENGPFEFSRTLASGSAYAVTVATQPTGQTCSVTNGSGTATANVTNITVVCAATTYTIGGTLSGLSSGTVVLQDNNTDNLSLTANGTFQFATAVAAGSAYKVTVFTQPSGQACTVTNGSGTANGNVTNVQVTCATSTPLTISVNATGISGGGSLIVKDDQGPTLTFSADGNQTFTNTYPSGASYSVTITQQPTGETCTLSSNAVGTITANVAVTATCANSGNTFTISGTLYDLSANSSSTGISLQNNNADTLTLTTNGPFTFATAVAGGSTYDVTVSSPPTNPSQNCTVSNGSGTATANVTNVQVVCIGNWIWVTGSDLVAVGGIYSGGNKYPGTRFGTMGWKDASGNFWLFGGFGYDSNGPKVSQTTGGSNESVLSDLWKFNGTGWGFQGGQSLTGQCFDYPAGLNQAGTPSARSNGVSWIDPSGNLWMFGGYVAHNVPGFCPEADAFNDMWEFIGGQWIWVGGASTPSQAGKYGTKGVASSTNIPGARYYATGTTDSSGNFWLFGGYGVDSAGTLGYLNDLWKFDGTTWTWVAGSNVANVKGTYSGGSAAPGARGGANSWIDSSGNFWVFGGDAIDSANFAGPMNDLWKISLSGGQWTFVSGSTTNGAAGTYGLQGIPDPTNVPGTREFATSWQAPSGDVWIFGGQRLGGAFYTDLWKYSSGQWTWMSGSQTVDSLGVYTGTPDQLEPGSRMQAAPWVDASGNLWLFGGYGMGLLPSGSSVHDGFDSLQDVWEFQP